MLRCRQSLKPLPAKQLTLQKALRSPWKSLTRKDRSSANIRLSRSRAPTAGDDEGFGPRPAERGLPTEAGLNRFVWDMRYEGATKVPRSPLWAGGTDGPEAVPGKYQVRLTVNGKQYTAPLEIVPDPRLKVTQQDLEKQFDLLIEDPRARYPGA